MPTQNSAITPGALGPAGPQGPAGNDSQDLNCLGPWGTWVTFNNTGTQHDVAYPLASGGIRKTSGGDVTITTVEATVPSVTDGQCLFIENISTTGVITIPDEFVQPSTRTANRFNMPNNQPCVIGLNEVAHFRWSAANSRWALVSKTHPCDEAFELTPRQLQQIACVPTTVGLTDVVWNAGGVGNNIGQPAGGVGFRFKAATNPATWTGIAAGVNGQCIQFYNDPDSTTTWTLPHETGSAAANQFSTPGARPVVLEPGEHVVAQYDAEEAKWVIVSDADSEGGLTPAQVRRNTCIPTTEGMNNYAPTGTQNSIAYPAGGVGYAFTGTAALTVTGMVQQTVGTCVHWYNNTTNQSVTFVHNNGTVVPGSPANNQFKTPGGRPFVLEPGEFATWVYDGTGKWVLINDGDSEVQTVTAVQATCIPTVVGLDPLTAAPPTNGSHYPAGEVGYEFTGASDITVYGLQIRPNGTCCQWHNGSTKDVTFIHLSGGATLASQRIALPEASTPGDTYKMKPGSHMVMQYRSVSPAGSIIPNGVWVVTSITEGE